MRLLGSIFWTLVLGGLASTLARAGSPSLDTTIQTDEKGVPVKLVTTYQELNPRNHHVLKRTVKTTELGNQHRAVRVTEAISEYDPRADEEKALKLTTHVRELDEATQKIRRLQSTVRVFDPKSHGEISCTRSINDFEPGTGLPSSRKQTIKLFDLKTGKPKQLTAIDTKVDGDSHTLVHTIIVADFEPASQRLLAKTTKVEYEDFQGGLASGEGAPNPDVADPLDGRVPQPQTATPAASPSAKASFSSPFQSTLRAPP